MRTPGLIRFGAALAGLAALWLTGFALTRWAMDEPVGEAQPAPVATMSADEVLRPLEEERALPRFKGEILGVFIAPTVEEWPAALQRDRSCERPARLAATDLDFARPLRIPAGWSPRDPEQPMPAMLACGTRATLLNWEFTRVANGLPASFGITRTVDRALAVDVAASRVEAAKVAGAEVILVRPLTPDGLGQTSQVVFPETFGFTSLYAFNIPESELLALASIVADAR